eukprot:jgi/Psemu1/12168/gm1.12168_g
MHISPQAKERDYQWMATSSPANSKNDRERYQDISSRNLEEIKYDGTREEHSAKVSNSQRRSRSSTRTSSDRELPDLVRSNSTLSSCNGTYNNPIVSRSLRSYDSSYKSFSASCNSSSSSLHDIISYIDDEGEQKQFDFNDFTSDVEDDEEENGSLIILPVAMDDCVQQHIQMPAILAKSNLLHRTLSHERNERILEGVYRSGSIIKKIKDTGSRDVSKVSDHSEEKGTANMIPKNCGGQSSNQDQDTRGIERNNRPHSQRDVRRAKSNMVGYDQLSAHAKETNRRQRGVRRAKSSTSGYDNFCAQARDQSRSHRGVRRAKSSTSGYGNFSAQARDQSRSHRGVRRTKSVDSRRDHDLSHMQTTVKRRSKSTERKIERDPPIKKFQSESNERLKLLFGQTDDETVITKNTCRKSTTEQKACTNEGQPSYGRSIVKSSIGETNVHQESKGNSQIITNENSDGRNAISLFELLSDTEYGRMKDMLPLQTDIHVLPSPSLASDDDTVEPTKTKKTNRILTKVKVGLNSSFHFSKLLWKDGEC